MRCPRRIYLAEDLRRGSELPPYTRSSRSSISPLTSSKMRRACGCERVGDERKKEGRKGDRERETSRRYEKPPPLGIELWLPARLRSKNDSAPSLSEYNCIYLDSPDWIIEASEESERDALSDPPSIERELKHFAMRVYSTFRRFGPFCYLSLSSYPLRNAFPSIVPSRLRFSFSTALDYRA